VLDIFDEEFARNPWPVLSALRSEGGGVHRVTTPDGPPAWLVTRFADVHQCLLNDRLSTNVRFADGIDYHGFAVPAPLDAFQTSDANDLARLRQALVAELAPRRLDEWPAQAAQLIEPTISQLQGCAEVDFVDRVAIPLPAVILSELLGLPDDARDQLLAWANATMRPGEAPRARDTLTSMREIIAIAIEYGHQSTDQTLLTRLITASNMKTNELAGLLFYLLFVWYEVLIDLLAGSVLALSSNHEQLHALRLGSDQTAAVDELLRFLSPQVLAGPRFAVADVKIGGHTIAAGQTALLCLASANHDPDRFDRPDELDLTRPPSPMWRSATAPTPASALRWSAPSLPLSSNSSIPAGPGCGRSTPRMQSPGAPGFATAGHLPYRWN
jgi:cytochrome P450